MVELGKGMSEITTLLGSYRSEQPSVCSPNALRSALDRLVREHFLQTDKYHMLQELFHFIFDSKELNIEDLQLSKEEYTYVSNIVRMKTYIDFCGKSPTEKFVHSIGKDHDFIAKSVNEWPLLKVINFAFLLAIPSHQRAAIVTSIRNEGISILEWLAHHRALGFSKFFVYTNDNTDGSLNLLKCLAENKIINLIENESRPETPIQTKVYEHSVHLLPELRDFEWVFYIDVDEFFIPRVGSALDLNSFFEEFHNIFRDNEPSAICFNWKWFGSENIFERADGLLLERFQHSIHNDHTKSLVKLRNLISMKPVHYPILFPHTKVVNGNFEEIAVPRLTIAPAYHKGQLNHYWNKSFEEFVIKRMRGRISVGLEGKLLDFSTFFDWGVNSLQGEFDPPLDIVLNRTKSAVDELLSIPGIKQELAAINLIFRQTLADIDRKVNLRSIYQKRGLGG
jgi:glycosyl transferase family 2